MRAFCEQQELGSPITTNFAFLLLSWARQGMSEFGDSGGCGIGQTTTKTLLHPDFLTDPHLASAKILKDSGGKAAANGGVMRTAVTGIPFFYDLDKTASFTVDVCKVTHSDPRCIASSVAIAITVAMILQGYRDLSFIQNSAFVYAVGYVGEFDQSELRRYVFPESIKQLALGDSSSIGYTYKPMGSAFAALAFDTFEEAIIRITMEAGDADTNCVVAGAVLGAWLGYNQLPSQWRDSLLHQKWLHNFIESFLKCCETGGQHKTQA